MKNYLPKNMKKSFLKTISTLSFSLCLMNASPVKSDIQYGSNSTRPDSLKVTFYEVGLTDSSFSKVFSVLNNPSGVEANIADANSVNNLVTGIKPTAGTYTHFYAVISNTYKVKGSSNGCYTKSTTVNMADGVFDASTSTDNGSNWCSNCAFDAWSAATSNIAEFGEAILTEQAFGVDSNGERDDTFGFGPGTPSTDISVGGIEVKSMNIYLTNSSNPYKFVASGTPLNSMPLSSTRDRALYYGELSSSVVVEENSKGTVQLYFDYSNGLAFDDDCDSMKFNSGDFDMSVITE
jgi:hypothetical protein